MKKMSIVAAMFAALTIASCGGGKEKEGEGKDTTETATEPTTEPTTEPVDTAVVAPADTTAPVE